MEMLTKKMVIYAGGRWRRVTPDGRVEGWRRRGRIVLALNGALVPISANNLANIIHKGPPLPLRPHRYRLHRKARRSPKSFKENHKRTVQNNSKYISNNENIEVHPKQLPRTPEKEKQLSSSAETVNLASLRVKPSNLDVELAQEQNEVVGKSKDTQKEKEDTQTEKEDEVHPASQGKELTINEDDVITLRNFIHRNRTNIDVQKFDSDERYRELIFFKLNPLVTIERCPEIVRLQSEHFARNLGLKAVCKPVEEAKSKLPVITKVNPPTQAKEVSSGDELFRAPPSRLHGNRPPPPIQRRPIVVPKRSSVPPGREYSTLEDLAIVSWLSADEGRQRAVNGNRIWRELQDSYHSITKCTRTWHSLRNRYLRYILPTLGSLAIPEGDAARLRSNAAIGKIKTRIRTNRDNSALHYSPIATASRPMRQRPRFESEQNENTNNQPRFRHKDKGRNERDQRPKFTIKEMAGDIVRKILRPSTTDSDEPIVKKSRKIRSSTSADESDTKSVRHTRSRSPRKRSLSKPRVNEDRKLANSKMNTSEKRLRSSSSHSPNKFRSPKVVSSQSRSSRSRQEESASPAGRSLRYSDVTRRFALRNRSTPVESPPPQPPVLAKKRRLYNPTV